MKIEVVRSPVMEEVHHSQNDHQIDHHQSQLTQRAGQALMMISKLRSRRQFSLENYLSFLHSPDLSNFTVDQLNMIVSIHGFKKLERRKQTEEAVRAIEPINLLRSTLEDNISSSFKANITISEAVRDLRSLNWQECSITSIRTINKQYHDIVANVSAKKLAKAKFPKAATAKKKRQQKQKQLDQLASSVSCSSSGPSSSNSTSDTNNLALALPVLVNTSAVKRGYQRPVLKRRKISSFMTTTTTTSCSGSSL